MHPKNYAHGFQFAIHCFCSMMTSQNGRIFRDSGLGKGNPPVTGGFPSQRPVMRGFAVFFDLDRRLSKQTSRRWFETPLHSLWRHCNAAAVDCTYIIYGYITCTRESPGDCPLKEPWVLQMNISGASYQRYCVIKIKQGITIQCFI